MFRRTALWLLVFVLQLQGFVAVGAMHCESKEYDSSYNQPVVSNTDHHLAQTQSSDDRHHDGATSSHTHDQASDDSTCHSSCPMAASNLKMLSKITLASIELTHFVSNPLTAFLDTPKRPPRLA